MGILIILGPKYLGKFRVNYFDLSLRGELNSPPRKGKENGCEIFFHLIMSNCLRSSFMWFTHLTGIPEHHPDQVRSQLRVEGHRLFSLANGRSFQIGHLEMPSLGELRERAPSLPGKMRLKEMVADVQDLHADPRNEGALFQVASQFNLLEMVDPTRTPEAGIGIYSFDKTQGPACAIAAGAGTIYRNYLVSLNGQSGQSTEHQIDCIADLGLALGNVDGRLWEMKNGYLLPSKQGLEDISHQLQALEPPEVDTLRAKLRIGIQWHTQVTLEGCMHMVSQAYCSALPVGYASHLNPDLWAPFCPTGSGGCLRSNLL